MEPEIWKNVSTLGTIVDGQGKKIDMSVYSNYEVSNFGHVRSLKFGKSKLLRPGIDGWGYQQVTFCNNGRPKHFKIHVLVGLLFLENPNGYPQINHISEDKSDNRAVNLEYCTALYNNVYNGRAKRVAEKLSKPVYQFSLDGELIKIWPSTQECNRNGFNQGHISACCRGERKTHKGFRWSYQKL